MTAEMPAMIKFIVNGKRKKGWSYLHHLLLILLYLPRVVTVNM